ncbi:MAG: nitroreductase family protein, partial [Oscillibacter sp.]|nr:nitroreductase family protein [Oscillibacter sp.]
MDFKTLSEARYSLRRYSDAPVEPAKLELVLKAAQSAPTAHNLQPQRVFVLESKEALEKVDAGTASHFHPPVMLVVAYDPVV